jgi:hypothetical protein
MENTFPQWLPDPFPLPDMTHRALEQLYEIFKKDFINTTPHFQKREVWHDRTILPGNNYPEGFLHIVQRDDFLANRRTFDHLRAERLPWCRPCIEHDGDTFLKVFSYQEGRGKIRSYIWLEQFDYVVVLEQRTKQGVFFLITAYHLDGESDRRRLTRKYENRIP